MWQLQDAKSRFSEFLDSSLNDGPQVVTRRGVEMAVLVRIEDWRELQKAAKPTLGEFLLGDGPRFEMEMPRRAELVNSRAAVSFE
jgi:prevent-host-death family protein